MPHSSCRRRFATLAAVLAAACAAAPAVARADPGDDPCSHAMVMVCRFVPILPTLDGDVDLTGQPPPADPAYPDFAAQSH